jgi:hypothetical protein
MTTKRQPDKAPGLQRAGRSGGAGRPTAGAATRRAAPGRSTAR